MEGVDFDMKDLTPMLSKFMDASGNIDPSKAPPDMTDLLERLKGYQQGQQQGGGAPVITPKPGFVVKATDPSGQKFFLNMCTSEHVISPASWQKHQGDEKFRQRIEEAVKVAPGEGSELLRFPMSLGDPRQDKDHSGQPCTVLDIVFSPQTMDMAEHSRPLKNFLVELALAWAARAHALELGGSGQWKLPRMRYKGDTVKPQRLRLQRNEPNLEEIKQPSTALRELQQAAAKTSQGAGVHLKQAATAPKRSTTAGKTPRPLPNASQEKQPQPAAKKEQSSKQAVQDDGGKPLRHTVEFHGRPVESVTVTVDLEPHNGRATSSSVAVGNPLVTVRRDQVYVEMHGREPLHIDLPFGVDAQQGKAHHMDAEQRLILELPYKPYRSFTEEKCRKLPLVNDFGFPDSYFMQLET
ncbi:g2928 [Coccomyxa viridis]|uniref:G2928 protein n=1 Tax=Coccomyxa viridis TaxID=1274662 RepID=A0ABP1FNU9_9CHLO